MTDWLPCPYRDEYPFDLARVRAHWAELHTVDDEPLPDSDVLLQAWALFHSGRFEEAAQAGLAAGVDGLSVANRATAAHAALVEPNEKRRLELFQRVHAQACTQAVRQPLHPNAWYWQGYALAGYAQGIHVARALAQGMGTRIRAALGTTLTLNPRHAYAHVALGSFHAAVIDKVGPLVGAMTYGSQPELVRRHVHQALELAPDSPAVLHECAHALLRLDGEECVAEATQLQERAASAQARDATERLWVELARTSLAL